MKKYVLICFILLMGSFAWASNSMEMLFEQANKQYLKGEYTTAIEAYKKIIRRGFEAPELYFNLANAYYKTKNIPAAILNYERALRLAPGNEDIEFNLKLSNLQIANRIEPAPEVFYEKWWNGLANTFSSSTWAVVVIILVNALFLMAAAFSVVRSSKAKKISFLMGFVFLFASLFAFGLTITQTREQRIMSAVVFAPVTYLKSSPDEKSENEMTIHEGNKVVVLDQVGVWRKVRLADGSTGWISSKVIREI